MEGDDIPNDVLRPKEDLDVLPSLLPVSSGLYYYFNWVIINVKKKGLLSGVCDGGVVIVVLYRNEGFRTNPYFFVKDLDKYIMYQFFLL